MKNIDMLMLILMLMGDSEWGVESRGYHAFVAPSMVGFHGEMLGWKAPEKQQQASPRGSCNVMMNSSRCTLEMAK